MFIYFNSFLYEFEAKNVRKENKLKKKEKKICNNIQEDNEEIFLVHGEVQWP